MTSTPSRFTLYTGPLSMFGAKAQIAALEKGLDFDVVLVHFDFAAGYWPRHPQVLRINPKQQVPVLIHDDLEIFDSTQIFEYLEDLQPSPALWPADVRERARARLVEHECDEVYFPHIIKLMGLEDDLQGEAAQAAIAAANDFYGRMESQLQHRPFLAGDTLSFADIAFYMAALFGERKGAPLQATTPQLLAWRDRMTARPAVRTVVGPMANWLRQQGRPVPLFLQEFLID